MVTKLIDDDLKTEACLILAKNHMVTKLKSAFKVPSIGLILAKNHMVTKQMNKV